MLGFLLFVGLPVVCWASCCLLGLLRFVGVCFEMLGPVGLARFVGPAVFSGEVCGVCWSLLGLVELIGSVGVAGICWFCWASYPCCGPWAC